MAAFVFPDSDLFKEVSFQLESHTMVHESPLNRVRDELELDGARWIGRWLLEILTPAEAARWKAFLASLRGRARRFEGYDNINRSPRGVFNVGLDFPLVNGIGQVGHSLIIDGLRNSIANIFLIGDYFQLVVGGTTTKRLHMITEADISSDGGGNATLKIEPALRGIPADDAALVFIDPVCEMTLSGDDQASWTTVPGQITEEIQLIGIEALV